MKLSHHSDESLGWLVTTLAIAAKTCSNVGWFVNYMQNMELFPTTARVSGMNLTATVATIVGISAPYVLLLVGIKDNSKAFMENMFYVPKLHLGLP